MLKYFNFIDATLYLTNATENNYQRVESFLKEDFYETSINYLSSLLIVSKIAEITMSFRT